MTLPSRHRIWNLNPGGLRPNTLPLGHEGYTWLYMVALCYYKDPWNLVCTWKTIVSLLHWYFIFWNHESVTRWQLTLREPNSRQVADHDIMDSYMYSKYIYIFIHFNIYIAALLLSPHVAMWRTLSHLYHFYMLIWGIHPIEPAVERHLVNINVVILTDVWDVALFHWFSIFSIC